VLYIRGGGHALGTQQYGSKWWHAKKQINMQIVLSGKGKYFVRKGPRPPSPGWGINKVTEKTGKK